MPNRLYSFRVNTESDSEMVKWLDSRKNLSAWVKKSINNFMSRKSYVYTLKLTFWGTFEGERICTHVTTDWPSVGGLTTNELARIAHVLFGHATEEDTRFSEAEDVVCMISLTQSLKVPARDWDRFGYVEPLSVSIIL